MNIRWTRIWKSFAWLLITVLISDCRAASDIPSQTTEASISQTDSAAPETTEFLNITETAERTLPAITLTPTQLDTPSPTNTLTTTEVQDWVIERLHDNGGCQLPCIWGITPGISTLREYLAKFSPLSRYLEPDYYTVIYGPNYGVGFLIEPQISSRPATNPNFPEMSQGEDEVMVTMLDFRLGFKPTGSSENDRLFLDAIENLNLHQILTDLGRPNRVLFQPQIGNVYWVASDLPYSLALMYEAQGVLVLYSGPVIYPQSDGTLRHCFNYPQDGGVRIITHLPSDGLSLSRLLEEAYGVTNFNDYVDERIFLDVENATGVSVDEFYEIYRNPANSNLCLTSLYTVWHSDE